MILLVLHDAEKLKDVLAAWEECGISGATILYNTGIGSIRKIEALRDDIPLIPSFSDFFSQQESHGRTLFTILENDDVIPALVAATEAVVGGLDLDGNGILAVLPVSRVYGIRK
jgi:hypothetical protein